MPEISKITLPSGTVYELKDAVARMAQSGAMHYLGKTTTALSDGSTTATITIDGDTITVGASEAGAVVIYGEYEYVWNGTKWQELGSSSSMKALAFKDSASGSYTPNGSVSGTAITLNTTTIAGLSDPGTLPSLTMTVSNENLTIGFSQGTLPTASEEKTVATGVASVTQPSFVGTAATITVS